MSNLSSVSLESVLLHLPYNELQCYFLSRLDFPTLKAARCVNKLWKSLIDPCLEFHLKLSDSTKTSVQAFGTSRQIDSLTTTVLYGNYPAEGIPIQTKMLRLAYQIREDDYDDDDDEKEAFVEYIRFQRNNHLKKYVGLTLSNFRRVIRDFQYVEKFHIVSRAVTVFTNHDAKQQLSKVYLPNVKEIIITFYDSGFHQLLPFMKNYFPKLMSVNIANVAEGRKDRPLLYSWIFGFVGRHRKTLNEVSLILPEGMMNDRGSLLARVGVSLSGSMGIRQDLRYDLKTPPNIYSELKDRLKNLTTLKKLFWDVGQLEGHRRYTLGHTLLFSQTRLVELHIDNIHLKDDVSLWQRIGEVLAKFKDTLESLSLGGCFCGPPATLLGTHVFSCTWLKDCHHLKSLEMVVCGISVESIEDLPFKSIQTLNLGHMLIQDQIEYVARHMVNLESWELPQRACLVNILVPRITVYLFEAILHLPKLTKINIYSECAEEEEILQFVSEQQGIRHHNCIWNTERNGNMCFNICRDTFVREHSQLEDFILKNRVNPTDELDRDNLLEFFIRNIVAGRVFGIEDFDDDDDFALWDHEHQHALIALNNFFVR